ncbi:MAG: hypothetical protein D6712_05515 [Chloroflexi bacterium]|nr:MAG: hypothetical protein D6712_05515 [Chloroflexota bacterium]
MNYLSYFAPLPQSAIERTNILREVAGAIEKYGVGELSLVRHDDGSIVAAAQNSRAVLLRYSDYQCVVVTEQNDALELALYRYGFTRSPHLGVFELGGETFCDVRVHRLCPPTMFDNILADLRDSFDGANDYAVMVRRNEGNITAELCHNPVRINVARLSYIPNAGFLELAVSLPFDVPALYDWAVRSGFSHINRMRAAASWLAGVLADFRGRELTIPSPDDNTVVGIGLYGWALKGGLFEGRNPITIEGVNKTVATMAILDFIDDDGSSDFPPLVANPRNYYLWRDFIVQHLTKMG